MSFFNRLQKGVHNAVPVMRFLSVWVFLSVLFSVVNWQMLIITLTITILFISVLSILFTILDAIFTP